MKNEFLINGNIFEILTKAINNISNNEGDLILIEGEKGFGKTRLLKELENYSSRNKLISVYAKAPEPLYNMSLSNLQPYAVFNNVLNELNTNKKIPQNQRLVFNVGLTVLTGLPVVGDFVYMLKELKKDLQEYKKTKQFEKLDTNSNYLEVFNQYSQKNPCVLLIDDFHFADVQSVELLKLFSEKINSMKLILIVAYNPNFVQRSNFAMLNLLKQLKHQQKESIIYSLKPFDREQVSKAISNYYNKATVSENVVNWFIQKTYGVPLAIYEYLEYFTKNNIGLNQIATEDFDTYVPISVNSLFLSYVEQLTDEERNILSVCAAEGKEFSVAIASKILHMDVLTTVRKLKAIAQKTGIISSLGAKKRYGEMTTIFTFNQAVYQTYFEEQLEYEEKKELHTQISMILKQNYDNAQDNELKKELLPYIISHSGISGNEDLIKEVLQDQYAVAKENNDETMLISISNFLNNVNSAPILNENVNSTDYHTSYYQIDDTNTDSGALELKNFEIETIKESNEPRSYATEIVQSRTLLNFDEVVELIATERSEEIISLLNKFIQQSTNQLDKVKSILLLAKFLAENNKIDEAKELIHNLSYQVDEINPSELDILYLNTLAILNHNQNSDDEAISLLKKASELSIKMDNNYKILTLSNISIILKKYDYESAIKYRDFVLNIAKELNYTNFIEDYLKQF